LLSFSTNFLLVAESSPQHRISVRDEGMEAAHEVFRVDALGEEAEDAHAVFRLKGRSLLLVSSSEVLDSGARGVDGSRALLEKSRRGGAVAAVQIPTNHHNTVHQFTLRVYVSGTRH
jgi:hypothetical protein